jgi:exodeoxyribonuclease VII small subunit
LSPKKANPPDAAEPRSFESAFVELQRVVEQLEDGGLDLEDALRAFERGTHLVQTCQRIIDEAELRVTRLTAESAGPASPPSTAPASPTDAESRWSLIADSTPPLTDA